MNTNDGVDKISWIISFSEIVNVPIIAFLKNMMVFLDIHAQQVMLVQLQWMVYIYTHVYMTVKDLHAQHWWPVGTSNVFLMMGKILKILERYNPNHFKSCRICRCGAYPFVKSLIAWTPVMGPTCVLVSKTHSILSSTDSAHLWKRVFCVLDPWNEKLQPKIQEDMTKF